MQKETKSYIIATIIPLITGGLSALFTMGNMDLYETIERPPLSPPAILFPIVWTVLYTLMGISSGIIYNSKGSTVAKNNALGLYGFQLFINFFWSIVFFNARAFLWAFVLIVVLWISILVMIIKFYKINKTAGLLQIPYLLWVFFAAYLTLSIYLLNR